jgi:hypothetical protein
LNEKVIWNANQELSSCGDQPGVRVLKRLAGEDMFPGFTNFGNYVFLKASQFILNFIKLSSFTLYFIAMFEGAQLKKN